MQKQSAIITTLLLAVVIICSNPADSQSEFTALLLEGNSIISVNLQSTFQRTLLSESVIQPQTINSRDEAFTSPQLDSSANILYYVNAPRLWREQQSEYGQVAALNINDSSTSVVYEAPGIFNIVLSSNESQAVVSFFENGIATNPIRICVLDLASGQCTEVNLLISSSPIKWINDSSFLVVSLSPREMYIVDAQTLQMRQLSGLANWQINVATPIPGTQSLLVSANSQQPTIPNSIIQPQALLVLDLNTEQLSYYTFQPPAIIEYSNANILDFSVSGRYLIFGSYSQSVLVEYTTGQQISQFNDVAFWRWFTNSDELIGSQRLDNSGEAYQIIRVFADSGSITPVSSASFSTIPVPP